MQVRDSAALGLVPIATLVVLEIFLNFARTQSRRFRRLLNGQPAIIIRRGQLDIGKLRQIRLTTDEVIGDTPQAEMLQPCPMWKYGVIEPDGTLTVILKQPQQPVTAEMLGITPEDTGLPLVVVSDGKMVPRSRLLRISPADIERRLKNQSIAVEDVFPMTLDDCGNTFLQKEGPCMKRLLTAAVLCAVLILGSVGA